VTENKDFTFCTHSYKIYIKPMLKVKIYSVLNDASLKVSCILGWDEEKEKVVVLKGERFGEMILKDKFLDKRTRKHISVEDGKDFIVNLPFSLTGSRVFAGKVYEEEK